MTRIEMYERLSRLYEKRADHCYGLFYAMNRYGEAFDWLDKCRAYECAIQYLWKKLNTADESSFIDPSAEFSEPQGFVTGD